MAQAVQLEEINIQNYVFAVGRNEVGGVNLLGTAFAVASNRLATAQHVVGVSDENLVIVIPREPSILDYQDTSDTMVQLANVRIIAADPLHDLCVLELVDAGGITAGFVCDGTDKTPVGSTVRIFGFPHANSGRMVLTQHTTQVGARILIKDHGQLAKHIVLNTQAREGQSGGPVLDETGRVTAIVIGSYAPGGGGRISLGGVDPTTLHQTTHAVSAEYLKGML